VKMGSLGLSTGFLLFVAPPPFLTGFPLHTDAPSALEMGSF